MQDIEKNLHDAKVALESIDEDKEQFLKHLTDMQVPPNMSSCISAGYAKDLKTIIHQLTTGDYSQPEKSRAIFLTQASDGSKIVKYI